MRYIMTSLVMVLGMHLLIAQSDKQAVILISSSSSPVYIGDMKKSLEDYGLILNVEKELWKSKLELEEFAFTLTNKKSRNVASFSFKYNDLNKHQIFLVYPLGDNKYGHVMADVDYMKESILPLVVNMDSRKKKPVLHRSYGKSGKPYRQTIVLDDLTNISNKYAETRALYSQMKADQTIGRPATGLTYTYNGEYLQHPGGIKLNDMTADVLIENLEEGVRIINIWSDEPLVEQTTGSTIAGNQ